MLLVGFNMIKPLATPLKIHSAVLGCMYTVVRPPDKSAYLKKYFLYFSSKTYVVGTQKNRLNETVLLSTQNTCLN